MKSTTRLVSIGILSAVLAVSSCGSDEESSTATTTAKATSATTGATTAPGAAASGLTISGFAFSPATGTAGEVITIENKDTAGHTVTADDDSFDIPVGPGASAELVIPAAGTYAIHCNIHSSMTGTIVVS